MGLWSVIRSLLGLDTPPAPRADMPTRATAAAPTSTAKPARRQPAAYGTRAHTARNHAAPSRAAAPSKASALRSKPTPAPLLPQHDIDAARTIIGPIEKHDLSDEQISAIAGAGHNTLVLAGAGTGKTTVIAGYVAWLLATGKARPDDILVLSFTRKSADDMSARIRQATGSTVHASTFHSLGLEICTASRLGKPVVLTDAEAERNIFQPAFGRMLREPERYPALLALLPDYLRSRIREAAQQSQQQAQQARHSQYTRAQETADAKPFIDKLSATAKTVITHMRAQNLDIEALRRLNEQRGGKHTGRNRMLLDLLDPVYRAYMSYLRDHRCIDFAGMITGATDAIRSGDYRHGYKYVLIDEYQDMSLPRYRLVRALREQRDFSLFCVGDDWQSIYRFAGSDIRLILDFANVWGDWGPTTLRELTVTRRFGPSLIDASGEFIMRDTSLYHKQLRSTATATDHSLKVLGGHGTQAVYDALVKQLRALRGKAPSVLLLGRYNSDIMPIKRADSAHGLFRFNDDGTIVFREKPGMTIEFMTVHKSKGLQRDYVFLLCCTGGMKGFPSTIPPEPLIGLLLPEAERMPDAEERRLFYVAMTRCRKKVFFMVDTDRPSRFIYELHKSRPNIFRGVPLPEQCPACGEALVTRMANGNPDRTFTACTGYPQCRFTRDGAGKRSR